MTNSQPEKQACCPGNHDRQPKEALVSSYVGYVDRGSVPQPFQEQKFEASRCTQPVVPALAGHRITAMTGLPRQGPHRFDA